MWESVRKYAARPGECITTPFVKGVQSIVQNLMCHHTPNVLGGLKEGAGAGAWPRFVSYLARGVCSFVCPPCPPEGKNKCKSALQVGHRRAGCFSQQNGSRAGKLLARLHMSFMFCRKRKNKCKSALQVGHRRAGCFFQRNGSRACKLLARLRMSFMFCLKRKNKCKSALQVGHRRAGCFLQ
jgi:hypothetical protein